MIRNGFLAVAILGVILVLASSVAAQPVSWTIRPSNTTVRLKAAGFGVYPTLGPAFVAVGGDRAFSVSLDGANWSTTGLLQFPPLDWASIAFDGQGTMRLGGTNSIIASFFPQGTSIGLSVEQVTQPSCYSAESGSVSWWGMASGGGLWSAVGPEVSCQETTCTWRWAFTRPGGVSRCRDWSAMARASQTGPNGVAFGAGVFVATLGSVSSGGGLLRSADGVSYTQVATVPWAMAGIAFGAGRFVAVGSNASFAVSTDGGVSWGVGQLPIVGSLYCVTFGGGYFVAGGDNGLILYSTDGVNWIRPTSPTTSSLFGASSNGSTWVLVGENGTIVQSSSLPDLASSTPSGWAGPIIVSNQLGATTNGTVRSDRPSYLSFGVRNAGATTASGFRVEVLVNGSSLGTLGAFSLPGNTAGFLQNVLLGALPTGSVDVTVRLDSSGAVTESNEGNNSVTYSFVVLSPCRPDFNDDGALTVADIFAFLSAWFVADPRADFDGVSGITVGDIFAFLAAWFAGC